jgi:hypothetical protein
MSVDGFPALLAPGGPLVVHADDPNVTSAPQPPPAGRRRADGGGAAIRRNARASIL